MTDYDTTILCPDSDAGTQALHERMGEGWEFFCYWSEHVPVYVTKPRTINHIALRRKRPDSSRQV